MPCFPFSNLAATNTMNNVFPSIFMQQNYRTSFDFLEMDSGNLLEMTGDNYNTLVNQTTLQSIPQYYPVPSMQGGKLQGQKPQVPPFPKNKSEGK